MFSHKLFFLEASSSFPFLFWFRSIIEFGTRNYICERNEHISCFSKCSVVVFVINIQLELITFLSFSFIIIKISVLQFCFSKQSDMHELSKFSVKSLNNQNFVDREFTFSSNSQVHFEKSVLLRNLIFFFT